MFIKITVYTTSHKAAYYDLPKNKDAWFTRCLFEMKCHIIQGFTITESEE